MEPGGVTGGGLALGTEAKTLPTWVQRQPPAEGGMGCTGVQRCPQPHSLAAGPRAQTTLQHHSQPHTLASLLSRLKAPAAPTRAGRLCTHHGMTLRLIPAVAESNGKRWRGVCKVQQTPVKQPCRGGGRNILAGVAESLDNAFGQSS